MTSPHRAIVAAHFPYPDDILAAQASSGVPLSAALAMLTMETGGANVFGHDPVRPPQQVGGHVTRELYRRYLHYRGLGYGNQGVGPCQLTGTGLQDQADHRGGCWKPLHNMEVGFTYLHNLAHTFASWQLAFQHYNGSGPRAVAYGQHAHAIMAQWHNRLT